MGKIVKYCSSCDESFAEKFGFCPTCGTSLQAFEMNPLVNAAAVEAVLPTPAFIEEAAPEPIVEKVFTAPEPVIEDAPPQVEKIVEPIVEPPVVVPVVKPLFVQTKPVDVDRTPLPVAMRQDTYSSSPNEGGFHITVIEEKNVSQRAGLLVGTLGIMIVMLLSATVYSLFNKDLDIGAINDDMFNAILTDIEPMTVEDEIQQKKEEKKGGGGGGGGREDEEETTKGDLADQSKNPTRPPNAKTPRMENPSLRLDPPQTEGDRKFPKENDRWGDPNGRFASLSNGTGTGGGQGSGRGTGQGSGAGTGAGSGNGSGSGSGNGNGNGDGDGPGGGGGIPPPPARPAGVTQKLSVLSKPRPGYTDAARTSNTQGVVILRVTFLGSGQIGSINTVKGLPNGLTEKAVEAARRISFTPKKIDGVGQSVTKQIEYTFSIF